MLTFDSLIIGFGKAGKTLAAELADKGQKVALIEKDPNMYGGTCINIACIPTKILVHNGLHNIPYTEAIERKNGVVEKLREKNYKTLADNDQVTIFNSAAKFRSDKELEITIDGEKEILTAEHIFINTGSTPVIPPIKGNIESDKVYTSTTLIERKVLPEKLVIVGAGYIGLEYASMYNNFGSEVTVISPDDGLLSHEDTEIVAEVQKEMEAKGVRFVFGNHAEEIKEETKEAVIVTLSDGEKLNANAVLLATGRKPNVEHLGLENTTIKLNVEDAIQVDEHLQTTAENVWAMGDVKGGMQFTYISLDDSRIVMDSLFGDKQHTLKTRAHIPYSVFIDPPLSRVGLTAKQAINDGYEILEGKLPIASHPRAHVINDLRGLFKVVVDKNTNLVLGASLFGADSHEVINLVKMAMDLEAPYTFLRDQIYNHPVMSESFNALFDVN